MERIPILLADDHAEVCGLIRARLERAAVFDVVGQTDNSIQTVECARSTRPQIVLIDPMMSDGMGLDAIRQIVAALPDTVVVVLTAFTDTAQQIELRKLGVRHILNKGIESYKLVGLLQDAVRSQLEKSHTRKDC